LHGRSSYKIATVAPQSILYCIDGWEGYNSANHDHSEEWCIKNGWPLNGTLCTLEFFKQNVKDCANIRPIKGHSPQCVRYWTEPVDYVFLDALHKNPSDWDNIEFWLPKIKTGGIFVGHDFYADRSQWPDVHDNVRRLEAQLEQKVKNPSNTSIWYFNI
jgi:hypothetical protein